MKLTVEWSTANGESVRGAELPEVGQTATLFTGERVTVTDVSRPTSGKVLLELRVHCEPQAFRHLPALDITLFDE